MSTDHLVFLSIPGLHPDDIDTSVTPTLYGWANAGALAELVACVLGVGMGHFEQHCPVALHDEGAVSHNGQVYR